MAWSLVAIFSMSSLASSGVFNLFFPLAMASRSCLEWGRKPSMNMFNWIGSLNPSVGVLQSRPRNQSWASLSDSSRLGEMMKFLPSPRWFWTSRNTSSRTFQPPPPKFSNCFPWMSEAIFFLHRPGKKKTNWGGWHLSKLLLSSLYCISLCM